MMHTNKTLWKRVRTGQERLTAIGAALKMEYTYYRNHPDCYAKPGSYFLIVL